jgi:hypothetical protein
MSAPDDSRCELCGRRGRRLQRHHLVPRTRHRNKRIRRERSLEDLQQGVAIFCPACHDMVHAVLDTRELAHEFASLEDLRGHRAIARFVKWVRRQPTDSHVKVRRPTDRRRRGRRRR